MRPVRLLPFVFFGLTASLLAQSNSAPLLNNPANWGPPSAPGSHHLPQVAHLVPDKRPVLRAVDATRHAKTQTAGLSFAPVVTYGSVLSQAVADVNGDGKPDLIVVNGCVSSTNCANGAVGVMLGNGDGTFQTEVTYNSGGYYPNSAVIASFGSLGFSYGASLVAVADVNGDGNPDLVVANACASSTNCANGTIGVLLGNGDGTFQPVVTYDSGGYYPNSAVVADVNGDGNVDLVVANTCGNTVASGGCPTAGDGESNYGGVIGVLLGNGDGTFQTAVTYASGGQDSTSVAVVDLNADGAPDLVVANDCPGPTVQSNPCGLGDYSTVSVLLGNGDGTFQTAVDYNSGGYFSETVAVADVNGDGKLDLVVASGEEYWAAPDGAVGVLLGNGDGTFQQVVPYVLGSVVDSVAIADVNGDGKPDLIVSGCQDQITCETTTTGNVNVLLGNGDGTFQPAVTFDSSGQSSYSVVVADVNGDGKPDLVVGDVNVNCSSACIWSDTTGVLINTSQGPVTNTLVSSPNPSLFGQAVTLTATVKSQGFAATPTGAVTFTDGTVNLGSGSLTAGVAILITSSLAAGTQSITAAYSGDSNFTASNSPPVTQTVGKASTTTSLTASPIPAALNQPVTYTATITSQYGGVVTGTVSFENGAETTVIPVSGGIATLTESYTTAGPSPMTAVYSGDSNNAGSTSPILIEYVKTFPIATTTTVASSSSSVYVGQLVTFTASVAWGHGTPPDGELVTFNDLTTGLTLGTSPLSGGVATFTTSSLAQGTHTIRAKYSGDAEFSPSYATLTQMVQRYPTTTALTSSLNPSSFGQAVTFTATVTNSGGPTPTGTVAFYNGSTVWGTATLNSSGVAQVTISMLPVGTHPMTAEYEHDTYNAGSVSVVLNQTVN